MKSVSQGFLLSALQAFHSFTSAFYCLLFRWSTLSWAVRCSPCWARWGTPSSLSSSPCIRKTLLGNNQSGTQLLFLPLPLLSQASCLLGPGSLCHAVGCQPSTFPTLTPHLEVKMALGLFLLFLSFGLLNGCVGVHPATHSLSPSTCSPPAFLNVPPTPLLPASGLLLGEALLPCSMPCSCHRAAAAQAPPGAFSGCGINSPHTGHKPWVPRSHPPCASAGQQPS